MMNSSKKILIFDVLQSRNCTVQNLERRGFEVFDFFAKPQKNNSYSYYNKVLNIIRRFFFNDRLYYERLREKEFYNFCKSRVDDLKVWSNSNLDYALFFCAERCPDDLLAIVRHFSQEMISYQYDGVSVRDYGILKVRQYFDRIFVFDKNDLKAYSKFGFKPLTNCWYPDKNIKTSNDRDLFYVGVGVKERVKYIMNLRDYLEKEGLKIEAFLTIPIFETEKKDLDISFTKNGIPYSSNIEYVKGSKAIVDIKLPYHDGLSFRFFEAMNYNKKIITNNESVKNYDFYDSNNIFICNYLGDFDGLKEFLELPYREIDESIKNKYGFDNWINYVLDIESYNKIELY